MPTPRARRRRAAAVALAALAAAAAAGCTATGPAPAGGTAGAAPARALNVVMVANPQMTDLQQLTAQFFTPATGIDVNFTVLPENEVRDRISEDFEAQSGQYDVATVSNYEVPIYSANGWLAPLTPHLDADAGFDVDDVLPAMLTSLTGEDGQVYGLPFYGEGSFLMYRADVAAEAGVTIPERPTWAQVAEAAARLDGARPGMAGICLRGKPGWGEAMAPITTVVNTFGGAWFEEDWTAAVNGSGFVEATEFYVGLLRDHGQPGAAQSGFVECLDAVRQGRAAMWYDATSAAGILESADSEVRGLMGYAQAPVRDTASSGWLYTWAWGVQAASPRTGDAWEFVSWASSREYEELAGSELGWSRVPSGKRASLYANPAYTAEAPFAGATLTAIAEADPADPGVRPRPAPGIQFVAIPEFTALATSVSQGVSAAVAGQGSVRDALDAGQVEAEAVAARQR